MAMDYEKQEDSVIKTQSGFSAFRRLLGDIFSMKRDSAVLVASVLVTAVAATLYPLALGYAINNVASGNFRGLYLFAGAFFLLYLIQFFSNRQRTISSTKLAQSEIKSLRDRSFENLQYVPVSFFSKVKTGFLISRITNDAETLSEFLTFQLPAVVSGFTTVLVSIGIMFYKDFDLTLYALIVIPVLMVFSFSIQGKVRKNYLKTRKTIAAITGNLSENINAIRTIKSFNVENRMADRFDGLNKKNFDANMKASLVASSYSAIIRVIEAVGIALVLIEGALQLKAGLTTVGLLVAFVVYVQTFFEPVVQLSQLYNTYQSSMVGVARIYGIIDYPRQATEDTGDSKAVFDDALDMDNVSFNYGDDTALEDINLEIRRGEKIGIVGHTGAGKTTLSNLLMKFYTPTKGEISLDGEVLGNIETGSFRRLLAPVLQEPFMFKGSIYENILFSNPDVSKDDVNGLIRKFSLQGIFENLPNGVDTQIGEMGRNLSEGQRQAISILRAFVRDPDILILDEPTSQIDPYSESLIMNSLNEFLKEKTLILITHRFSMVKLVDRIVVLNQGKIVEEGTYDSLIGTGGIFDQLYRIQYGIN